MEMKQFAAVLGFAFVVTWIALNFGFALLCLIGAAVFYAGAAVIHGELDLSDVQDRLRSGGDGGNQPTYAPPAPPRATRVR